MRHRLDYGQQESPDIGGDVGCAHQSEEGNPTGNAGMANVRKMKKPAEAGFFISAKA
jgi:hypothetical protein